MIATVKNERASIDAWLLALERQSLTPHEVIVVDGGSIDGTWERLQQWEPEFAVRMLRSIGANISQGRNAAIAWTVCDVVAVTDAGTVASPDWLRELTTPLECRDVDVVGGFFEPVLNNRWSRSLAAATLPDADELDGRTFQPSSRSVAFRRAWWEAGVRYPEWLDYGEDLVWDLALRRAGARFLTNTQARVSFMVRPSIQSYFRQYYLYARGDGKAGLFATRHALRYVTYATAIVVVFRRNPIEIGTLAFLSACYVLRPTIRLVERDRDRAVSALETLAAVPIVILLRGCGDVAKMLGYPAGLLWRMRKRGSIDWRTRWTRVTPTGMLLRPGALATETQRLSSLPGGESQQDST